MKYNRKKYIKLIFKLISPLALSSGEKGLTDSQLIKDKAGTPYIPASSIAGVVSPIIKEMIKEKGAEEEFHNYFGNVSVIKGKEKTSNVINNIESRIIFYDGVLQDSDYHITIRDSVALDEHKTAKDGAKFDMEVLEPGVKFKTFFEQSFNDDKDIDYQSFEFV